MPSVKEILIWEYGKIGPHHGIKFNVTVQKNEIIK